MSKLIESRFYSVLLIVSDYLLLGLLWILGCLPIVTLVASCRGTLATVMAWEEKGTGHIVKHYLTNFKTHFGRSLVISLLLVGLLGVSHANLELLREVGMNEQIVAVGILFFSFVYFGLFCGYLRQDILKQQSFWQSIQQGVFDFASELPKRLVLTLITVIYGGLVFVFPLFLFIFAGAYWKLAGLLLRR